MTSRDKTIFAAVGIIGFGLAWGLWAEWPEMMNRDADEDSAPRRAAVVLPEKPAPLQPQGKQITYNFDSDVPGQPPANFHPALTGRGSAGKWIIQSDTTAPSKPNVVTQTAADTTDYRFPVLIADEGSFSDVDLSVKFKAVSGHVDQAAGLIFRLKDANNYYVVRANALENNLNLYKVVDGRRREITGSSVTVPSGPWHELRVEVRGNLINCYFDGAKQIDTTDSTFGSPGKIGLWTKADSVTSFDDLTVIAK
jgi:3-keto-disaccharide hydrolase